MFVIREAGIIVKSLELKRPCLLLVLTAALWLKSILGGMPPVTATSGTTAKRIRQAGRPIKSVSSSSQTGLVPPVSVTGAV